MSDGTLKTATSGQKAAGQTRSADVLGCFAAQGIGAASVLRHLGLGANRVHSAPGMAPSTVR